MVDYVRVAATAKRLIDANGRQISLIRPSTVPLDPLKPWKGSVPGDEQLVINGVFVPPNTVRQFGISSLGEGTEFIDLIQFSEQIAIVHQGQVDVRDYTTLRDNGVNWNILGIQVLRPAETYLLAFIGVRR